VFLDHFNTLIDFKKIKEKYFNTFLSEKSFKKQLQPHFQTGP
jgi:hypothetical protein